MRMVAGHIKAEWRDNNTVSMRRHMLNLTTTFWHDSDLRNISYPVAFGGKPENICPF